MIIYLYDGSFDGLLTAIFDSFTDKRPLDIFRQEHYQPQLFDEIISVTTENDKAQRVADSILAKLSFDTYQRLYYLYLSELPQCDYTALCYLKMCYRYGASIYLAKNNPLIHRVETYCRKVTLEAHRFTGFVRFIELAPMIFYSKIEPDHNILPLLQGHFVRRFSDQKFMIHDLKRQYALVYDLHTPYFTPLTIEEGEHLLTSKTTDPYQQLFAVFFDATTITQRRNLRLQKFWMPKRYWQHIDEAHD